MRQLTNENLQRCKRSRQFRRLKKLCIELQIPENEIRTLLSIYAIESFYRPFYFRLAEYAMTISSGMKSILFGWSMRNYTIGVCQLGLATICNFYGSEFYQHQPRIRISSFTALFHALSAISLMNSVRILDNYIAPILRRAERICPENIEQQICYVGEQYNGRYSYGLMLYEVYWTLFLSA